MKNTHHLPSLLHTFFLNHIQQFIPITRLFIFIKQCSDFKCANDSLGDLEKPVLSWSPPHPSPEVQTSTVQDRAQESAFLQMPRVILRQMVAKSSFEKHATIHHQAGIMPMDSSTQGKKRMVLIFL